MELYRDWKQRKAASLVEEAAAGKIEELTRWMEAKVGGIGDPDKDIGELLERNVSVECIREEVRDLKDKLAKIEEAKEILIAADGMNA